MLELLWPPLEDEELVLDDVDVEPSCVPEVVVEELVPVEELDEEEVSEPVLAFVSEPVVEFEPDVLSEFEVSELLEDDVSLVVVELSELVEEPDVS